MALLKSIQMPGQRALGTEHICWASHWKCMDTVTLTKEHLIELQRALAVSDMREDCSESRPPSDPIPFEVLVARFGHVKIQMYQEHGSHKRPHFHIEYKH